MLLAAPPAPENAVELAREFAFKSDHGAALSDLLGRARPGAMQMKALEDPIWIADQFLNPREVLVDMGDLMEMADRSGLRIERFLGLNENAAGYFNSSSLLERFQRLDTCQQLIALDLMMKPERYFVVMRKTIR
jgi:hypothetical protein